MISIKEIRVIIKEIDPLIKIESIKETSNIKDSGIDSLGFMDLLLNIEEKYQVKVPDDVINKIINYEDLIIYINSKGAS